jgi:nucleotide-binding universal stress UspA family protein
MQILAATDLSTRSNRAVRQAGLFAQALNADLTLLHVVDDDRSPHLVSVEQREAEKILREQSGSMPELRGTKCQPTVVTGDPFAEILRVAAAVGADFLVLGSHRK